MEGHFKRKFKEFFLNRNGVDEIGLVSFILSIILFIIYAIFPFLYFLLILSVLFLLYVVFRLISKNVYLREKENELFCNFFIKIFKPKKRKKTIKPLKTHKEKIKKEKKEKPDKNYLYHECPSCHNIIKIDRHKKGERIIVCNKCFMEMKIKVK